MIREDHVGACTADRQQRLHHHAVVVDPALFGGGKRVRGYLGSAEDRDWFAVTPTKTGLVLGTVNAPAGVDIVVFRDEDAKKVVNRRGAGDDEQFALEGEAGKPLFIGIARKLDAKKDLKEQALQGLDDPYELILNVTDK